MRDSAYTYIQAATSYTAKKTTLTIIREVLACDEVRFAISVSNVLVMAAMTDVREKILHDIALLSAVAVTV